MKRAHVVQFTRAHTVVTPATVLESVTAGGDACHVADIPETTKHYEAGQRLTFGTKRAACDFCKAMAGAAGYLEAP